MCNYVVHHNVSVWGADLDIFRPERWLDPTKLLSANDLTPFGVGHRACIERNIATMSIVKVLAAVWRRYDLELVDPSEKLVIESVETGEKQGPLMVRARLRKDQDFHCSEISDAVVWLCMMSKDWKWTKQRAAEPYIC